MPKPRDDIIGSRFGRLVVEGMVDAYVSPKGHRHRRFSVKCDCGSRAVVLGRNLLNGQTSSCGCFRRDLREQFRQNRDKTIIGKRFGRLTIVSNAAPITYKTGKCAHRVVVRCDCGSPERMVVAANVVRGLTTSCGCYRRENSRRIHATHEGKRLWRSEYSIWNGIIDRCENRNSRAYHNYGGRGISICQRWRNSFEAFLADMGRRPSPKHSIDRINNDGNYEPGNCRWATASEQANNSRQNLVFCIGGEKHTATEWCRKLGVGPPPKIVKRLRRGWTAEEALDLVPRKRYQGSGVYLRTKPPADESKIGTK